MTCKGCVHYGICLWTQVDAKHKKVCKEFKNKADFVEVVRCKDCLYWHKKVFDPIIEHYIGECHCSQWENDYFWYETSENNFCSYGKGKQQ